MEYNQQSNFLNIHVKNYNESLFMIAGNWSVQVGHVLKILICLQLMKSTYFSFFDFALKRRLARILIGILIIIYDLMGCFTYMININEIYFELAYSFFENFCTLKLNFIIIARRTIEICIKWGKQIMPLREDDKCWETWPRSSEKGIRDLLTY